MNITHKTINQERNVDENGIGGMQTTVRERANRIASFIEQVREMKIDE